LRNVTYRRVNIAHGLAVFVGYGLVSWKPALYLRQFDLSQTEVGAIVGVLGLVGGVPGMILGGYLADRLSLRDPRWPAWICALAIFLAFPTYLAALWIFDWVTASILFGLGVFFYQISHGPGLAIVQSVVEPHRRAQAAAYVFFVSNIFGLGLGPLLVGYVSDVMTPTLDVRSLNASLTLILLALVAAAIMYWRTAIALGERRRGRPETGRASEVSQVPTNPSQSTRSEA
jgi:MFS family permease